MAKKDKKPKLPKKVGGVKLPKQLRKSAGVVAEIAQNPMAREVVSAALAAGATALSKRKLRNVAGIATPTQNSPDFGKLMAQGTEIGEILAKGVTAFFDALTKPADKVPAPAQSTPEAKPAVGTPHAKPASRPKAGAKTTPPA